MAEAANSPFFPPKAELLTNDVQRSVVICSVVDSEVADLLFNTIVSDNIEDGLRDVLTGMPVTHFWQTEYNLVRRALFVSEDCAHAVEREAVA